MGVCTEFSIKAMAAAVGGRVTIPSAMMALSVASQRILALTEMLRLKLETRWTYCGGAGADSGMASLLLHRSPASHCCCSTEAQQVIVVAPLKPGHHGFKTFNHERHPSKVGKAAKSPAMTLQTKLDCDDRDL